MKPDAALVPTLPATFISGFRSHSGFFPHFDTRGTSTQAHATPDTPHARPAP